MTTSESKDNPSIKSRAQRLFDYYVAEDMRRIGQAHRDVTLAGMPDAVQEVVLGSAESFKTDSPHGLFLIGNVGTGKTSALIVLWKLIARIKALSVMENPNKKDYQDEYRQLRSELGFIFMTQNELVSKLRDYATDPHSAGSGYGEANLWYGPSILLLDDFGRAHDDKSGWNASLQFEYMDLRWRNKKPTFVTSNLDTQQLRSLGPAWEATIDRMGDASWMKGFTISGKSRRTSDTR